ncbi:MMPL family transporter [Blastopirellula sp. JC732]|uniref:MMPL family transporter n=1 Tax=Blastopirellula sediminis TaxID=2894196 RepID=A0A9X1MPC3_9BACT|nr:MMPL family transporter [Blastopirellula sediminis]MCC9629572.1 MMPL family transporter [Blastopirellula sediminis]
MQDRRPTFFQRYSLLILMAVFFLIPFALRGARLSLERMKNDVKDWLPDDFSETKDLSWFRDHFLGEQFVLISWEGCSADDQRLQLLAEKLVPTAPTDGDKKFGAQVAGHDQNFAGDRYGLYLTGNLYENWGGEEEKWFKGTGEKWYYLLPDGELRSWNGGSTMLGAMYRSGERLLTGGNKLSGEYAATVDKKYYKRPATLQAHLFKSVVTGPQVLAQLAEPGGSLLRDEENANGEDLAEANRIAHERLQGVLFGPDGEQTCLIATLSDAGKVDLRRTLGRGFMGRPLGRLRELAIEAGISQDELHLGGPPVDNVAIDEEGEITLARLVLFAVAVGVFLSYLCLRSIKLTIMVFFVGGVSAITSMSLVYWLGSAPDAVLMSMPAVVYVLGLAGAIHIINYYKDAVEEEGLDGAPEMAVAHGWRPCLIAALTTALGLGSLATSNIAPIKKFGIFSALGVMATLALLFTYLPAALQQWPPKLKKSKEGALQAKSPLTVWMENFSLRVADFIVARSTLVAGLCFLSFIIFGYGLTQIKTSVQLLKMFDGGSEIIQDYAWLEQHIGKLVPMELVVRVEPQLQGTSGNEPPADAEQVAEEKFKYTFLERMEMAQRVQNAVEDVLGPQGRDLVGNGMSVATFAPELPESGGTTRDFAIRGAYNRRLEEHREEFLKTDYLRQEADGAELWRVSLRLGALQDIEYGRFVTDLREIAEPVMAAYRKRDEILRTIDKANDGKGFVTERVTILGPNFMAYDEQKAKRDAGEPVAYTLDPQQIYAMTLRDLLINARLSVNYFDPIGNAEHPDGNSQARLDLLMKRDQYFVVVADSPKYDLDAIKAAGKTLIYATEYQYDPTAPQYAVTDPDLPQLTIVYTGVVPVVYKAARTLLSSLVESTLWAFGLIALVMAWVLKSVRAGIVSMLPNVFPVVLIFGFMGMAGIEVDIGTMMTASVAMGIAVDDTIHFLTWFRWGLDKGLNRGDAIREAYRRCAVAMMQTTIIGGLGLAVFAVSSFTPTQRFGYLMVSLLAAALLGDLVFLPALLAGPLGSMFRPDRKAHLSGGPSDGETPSEPESDDDLDAPAVIPVAIHRGENGHNENGHSDPSKRTDSHYRSGKSG